MFPVLSWCRNTFRDTSTGRRGEQKNALRACKDRCVSVSSYLYLEMFLVDLDENTALLILKHLGAKDLISLQIACKWGRNLASHECLWRTLCTERFSILNTHLFPASFTGHQASHSGLCANLPMDSNVFGSLYNL